MVADICQDQKVRLTSSPVVYSTMRLIINEIFLLEQFDNQRLAKYIRCMFQAILPLNDNLALQVAEQAVQIAREGSQVNDALSLLLLSADTFSRELILGYRCRNPFPQRTWIGLSQRYSTMALTSLQGATEIYASSGL